MYTTLDHYSISVCMYIVRVHVHVDTILVHVQYSLYTYMYAESTELQDLESRGSWAVTF